MPWRSAYSAIHFNSAIPPTSSGIRPEHVDRLGLDQLHAVLPQIEFLPGVNRRRCALGHFLEDLGFWVGLEVAGDQVFEPCNVQWFDRARKADGVLDDPAWPAVERQADVIAEGLSRRFGAGDAMVDATFGHQPTIHVRRRRSMPFLAIPGVRDGCHHGRIVEADGHLDQGVAFFGLLHLGGELGVILRRAGHRHGGAYVVFGVSVGTDAVADLSAEQLIDWQAGRLSGDIPECDFDGADRRAPGLRGAHAANLQHDARRRWWDLRRRDSAYRTGPSV